MRPFDLPRTLSYDINCVYSKHIHDRFLDNLPQHAHLIQDMEMVIPAVHIQNHIDSCMYLFGTAYQRCAAHFHAETAEQYWAEVNAVGNYTRQMNTGHRHDTICDHHGDWNYKKFNIICK
jgi:hypothetical protein